MEAGKKRTFIIKYATTIQLSVNDFRFKRITYPVATAWNHVHMTEDSESFFLIPIICAILLAFTSGLGEKNCMDQFIGGAADLMGVALVVGVARGINIILEDGMISDTILEFFSGAISGMNPIVFIILMMLVFIVLGFFISSSSGLAVLSIPIMAPLADTVGVSRSAIVSAYAYGLGLISFITPTGLILASLAMVDVTYDKWLKFIMPLMGMTTVFSAIMLIIQLYV